MTDLVITREIFDRLRQATKDKPGVLAELCRDYLVEARATIGQLREALHAGDAAAVRERAHYLKGSSMMLGAGQLSQCCATLEQMGRDSNLGSAASALEQAVAALQAVEAELSRDLGSEVVPAAGPAA